VPMRKGNPLSILFMVGIIFLFIYGVIALLIMRFEAGDVYPPYSSYRSDPRGARAFYEALSLLPKVKTVRNVDPLTKQSGLSEGTIFFLGMHTFEFSFIDESTVETVEDALSEGGRIIITFVPTQSTSASPPEKEKQETPEDENENNQEDEEQEQELFRTEYVDLTDRWSVETELSAGQGSEALLSAPVNGLPPSLAWHSTLVFNPQDTAWCTIYTMSGKPVLIERSYGKGKIVLVADSFLLSNEAMKSTRYPHLLAWLCGTHQKIIFDETHFGISKHPGVAALLRKYGLAPFFSALIMLALLAIWRQSFSFVPAHDQTQAITVNPGKDYSTGLTNLLRRNISLNDIIAAGLEEWKRSFTHGKQNLSSLLPRIQEIISAERKKPKKNRDTVHAYRKISALISTQRGETTPQVSTPLRSGVIHRSLKKIKGDNKSKEVS
jgi:hypothetical protein